MKAVAIHEKGKVGIVDIPMPTIREYECLVKVHTCGFCNSTDLKTIDDHLGSPVPFPVILGHEGVGEVVEVGTKVRNWKTGDRMTNPHGRLEPGTPFNRYWCGMVEYAIVQDHEVMRELGLDASAFEARAARRVPAGIDAEDGGVLLTLAETYSALDNFGFTPGMDVLVYGDGPVGLGLTTFLKMRGAGWVGCIGHHDDRLQRIAGKGGADEVINSGAVDVNMRLSDRRVDLVIDAVGRTSIVTEGSRRLKPRGKVGVYGVIAGDDAQVSLLKLQNNTAVHILSYPYGELDCIEKVCAMSLDGTLDLKAFYSHVLPMDEIEHAVDLIRSREAFKVILTT